MSKHTPGPWKVQQMEYGFAITDQEGYEISPTRNLSDARLIAAAPGLLQAAKDFVEWFECGRIGDMPKAELHYARDIIAKAQGGNA